MWTKKKLKEAAREYYYKHLELAVTERKRTTLEDAFLAGCKYIINNTQKEVKK